MSRARVPGMDEVFEWVLIYEGAVLLGRRFRMPMPPPVSHFIWALRGKRGGFLLPAFIVGYLGRHFWRLPGDWTGIHLVSTSREC